MSLQSFLSDFAQALMTVDARSPQASSSRSGNPYQAGIGPHSESETVRLVMAELASRGDRYPDYQLSIPYPNLSRQRADLFLYMPTSESWVVEFKLLRLLGDNGGLNDNMLMHLLSPYPQHRSALTDCEKLVKSSFTSRKAIVVLGYEAEDWPLEPALAAFETLAHARFELGPRSEALFDGLVHPVHKRGKLAGWELLDS